MIKRISPFIAFPLFAAFLFIPVQAFSQPITNKTVSDQMLIFEKRVLERLDNLSARISSVEEGETVTPGEAKEKVEMGNTLVSLQEIMGKFEEFSFVLTNLQQQVESMTKANQKTNEMFQQALGKVTKGNSYVEKELSYQISAIKMTLQDLNYKLYQTEDSLKKQISSVQERLGVAKIDESSYPQVETSMTIPEEAKTTPDISEAKEPAMVSTVVANVSMEDSYKTAYNDYLRQNYDLAIIGFTTFLQHFPDTSLSDNAQYWIGECYYSENKMEEAIKAFESLLEKFPRSNKILETTYKIARSYHEVGDIEKALKGYESLITDFPETAIADRAKEYIDAIKTAKPEQEKVEQNNL